MSTKTLVEAMVRAVREMDGQPSDPVMDPQLIGNLNARVQAFLNDQNSFKAEMDEIIARHRPFDSEWDDSAKQFLHGAGRGKDLRDALSFACLRLNHALVSFSPTRDDVAKWEWIVRELTYLLHK